MKITITAIIISLMCIANAFAGITVIANNGSGAVSIDDVKRVYLAKDLSWKLVNLSSAQQEFASKVLSKDVGAVNKTWAKLVFSGKAESPAEVSSAAEVVSFVKSNPKSLGYVPKGTAVAGVKVVTTVD